MTKILSRMTSPTGLLYIFLIVTQVIAGIYRSRAAEPPPAYTFLHPLVRLWVIGWWLQKDNRKNGIAWVYDMGLFLYMVWPLVMPYYLFKTRGVRALLTILIFAGVSLGALALGAGLYAVLAP